MQLPTMLFIRHACSLFVVLHKHTELNKCYIFLKSKLRSNFHYALHLTALIFPSALTSFPIPAKDQHSYSMMLQTLCLTMLEMCSKQLLFCHTYKPKASMRRAHFPDDFCVPYMTFDKLIM